MSMTETKPTVLTITELGDLRISAPNMPTLMLSPHRALEEATMPIIGKALTAYDSAREAEEGELVLVDPMTNAQLRFRPMGEDGARVDMDITVLITLLREANVDIDIDIAIDIDVSG